MVKEINLKDYCYMVVDAWNSVKSIILTRAQNKVLIKTITDEADEHIIKCENSKEGFNKEIISCTDCDFYSVN